jgi:23S rRNA (adenine2503-C2)-methyltransferase
MKKEDLRGLIYEDLSRYVKAQGEPPFRATQIYEWLYRKGARSFSVMKNLSRAFREKLDHRFILRPLKMVKKYLSHDGTTKFLFELDDHHKIESVLIPTPTRSTVCLSSQVGCKFGCRFCASGIGGWQRDLSTAEIVSQVLRAKDEARKHKKPLTHIVYMGVGEPLDNIENVMASIRILNDKRGLNIGARRITVSTCGVVPGIRQLAAEGIQIELAVSLHGYDNLSRNALMPVNQKYPFGELMAACRDYVKITNRQITFEYVLIKDMTCTKKAALALKKAFKGLICKMNLIPYNIVTEFDYLPPSRQEMIDFQKQLRSMGVHATLRLPRGRDVAAACGQLRREQGSQ